MRSAKGEEKLAEAYLRKNYEEGEARERRREKERKKKELYRIAIDNLKRALSDN